MSYHGAWQPFTVYCDDPSHAGRSVFPAFRIALRDEPLTHLNVTYRWILFEAGIGGGDGHPLMHRIKPGDFPDDERESIAKLCSQTRRTSGGRGMNLSGVAIATRYLAVLDCAPAHGLRVERRANQLAEDFGVLAGQGTFEVSLTGLSWIIRKRAATQG